MDWALMIAVAGIAIGVITSGFGSTIGIGIAAEVADGALTEDPEKFGAFPIMVALPGTQGIYGFVCGFLAIIKLGFLGGIRPVLTMAQGWQMFFACMPVGIAGWMSGIWQGKVSAYGISMATKQTPHFMKGVIYAAMVETYAILGLLTTILLLNGIKLG